MLENDMKKKAIDIADVCYYLFITSVKDNAKARNIDDIDAFVNEALVEMKNNLDLEVE